MLPKRKIIKKRHVRPPKAEEPELHPETLIEKLKSTSNDLKEEALTFLANLTYIPYEHLDHLILNELITCLYLSNNAIVYSCLFAINNLCQLEFKNIAILFELGLDKALIQLKSTQKQLLKPILLLMMTLADGISQKYSYLIKGVQNSITIAHMNQNSLELILEFFMRIQSDSLSQTIYQKIYQVFEKEDDLKKRAMAMHILVNNQELSIKLMDKCFEFIQQIMDLNLETEYQVNIKNINIIESTKPNKQIETELMEEEQGDAVQLQQPANYDFLIRTVQALEITMESLLNKLQNTWEEEFEEDEDIEIQGNEQIVEGQFQTAITSYFVTNSSGLVRNVSLPFVEGQNLAELSLRMLSYLPDLNKEQIVLVITRSIENSLRVNPPEEVLAMNINIGLLILIKHKASNIANNLLLSLGETAFKLSEPFKESWISLLELYSVQLNPERMAVTPNENERVGLILKNLLINIPYLELEEWRAQTIDTIFDVYSNEDHDKIFVDLGFIQLLEFVLKNAKSSENSNKKKKKFIREVIQDIHRFLEYKRKMIKF